MKKLLLITAVLVIAIPLAASAQEDTLFPKQAYVASTDPEGTELGDAPWVGPYTVDSVLDVDVADGDTVWVGVENLFRWVNLKTLEVTIVGGGALTLTDVIGYTKGGAYGAKSFTQANVGGDLVITAKIFPQPDWEVLVLVNNSGGNVTITSIDAKSRCKYVPTMTYYGLGILALLLIGSTVWVLRRKRAGAVA